MRQMQKRSSSCTLETPKNVFSFCVMHSDENSVATMKLNVSGSDVKWIFEYQYMWMKTNSQPFEKLSEESMRDRKYL